MQISKTKTFFAFSSLILLSTGIMLFIKSIVLNQLVYFIVSIYLILASILLIRPYYKERWKNKPMKTLADFKRKIQKGVKLHTTYHKKIVGYNTIDNVSLYENADLGIAEVSQVKSTQFAIKRLRNGEYVDSWLTYPKASECKIIDDNTIEIYEVNSNNEMELCLTYKFV